MAQFQVQDSVCVGFFSRFVSIQFCSSTVLLLLNFLCKYPQQFLCICFLMDCYWNWSSSSINTCNFSSLFFCLVEFLAPYSTNSFLWIMYYILGYIEIILVCEMSFQISTDFLSLILLIMKTNFCHRSSVPDATEPMRIFLCARL